MIYYALTIIIILFYMIIISVVYIYIKIRNRLSSCQVGERNQPHKIAHFFEIGLQIKTVL